MSGRRLGGAWWVVRYTLLLNKTIFLGLGSPYNQQSRGRWCLWVWISPPPRTLQAVTILGIKSFAHTPGASPSQQANIGPILAQYWSKGVGNDEPTLAPNISPMQVAHWPNIGPLHWRNVGCQYGKPSMAQCSCTLGQCWSNDLPSTDINHKYTTLIRGRTGVIGSDVPWLECPACNTLTCVITVTE